MFSNPPCRKISCADCKAYIMNVEIACDSVVLIMVMQTLIAAQTTSAA